MFFSHHILFSSFADSRDKVLWEKRYETEAYILGKEPVEFLKEHIGLLPRGKALDLAMGEGRNAVFLAKHGFEVDGCDISEHAVKKSQEAGRGESCYHSCLYCRFRDVSITQRYI